MTSDQTNHHDAPQAPRDTESAASPAAPAPDAASAPEADVVDGDAVADGELVTDESQDELAARAAKADEYLALAQRKQAEFENFRKRASRDAATAQERGAARLATALLPAIDNLERALQHAPEELDEHGFVAGVRHVHSDLIAALQRVGIEQYSPEGEPFDPNRHEAIAQQPTDGAQPGTVVEVYQRGYSAGETVVRPARVVVAG